MRTGKRHCLPVHGTRLGYAANTDKSCTCRHHSGLISPPRSLDMTKQACGPAEAVVYMEPDWDTSLVGVDIPNEGILSALIIPPRDLDMVKPLCELIRKFTGAWPTLGRVLIVSVVGASTGEPMTLEVSSASRYS